VVALPLEFPPKEWKILIAESWTGSTEIPFILDFAGAHDIPFRMVTVFLATWRNWPLWCDLFDHVLQFDSANFSSRKLKLLLRIFAEQGVFKRDRRIRRSLSSLEVNNPIQRWFSHFGWYYFACFQTKQNHVSVRSCSSNFNVQTVKKCRLSARTNKTDRYHPASRRFSL